MNRNDPNELLRRSVRRFYGWLLSLAIAGAGPFAANALIDMGTVAGRAAGVAVGVLAWAPMIWVVTKLVRAGDEFERRLHLTALAVSFVCALVLIGALDWLVRAEFLAPPPLNLLWLLLALLWFLAIVGTKRWYERT